MPAAAHQKKTKTARPPATNTKAKTSSAPTAKPQPKLNAAQRDVLKSLAKGPKFTSNVTGPHSVSGVASNALQRAGLVKVKAAKAGGAREVSLTAAGTKLLAKL